MPSLHLPGCLHKVKVDRVLLCRTIKNVVEPLKCSSAISNIIPNLYIFISSPLIASPPVSAHYQTGVSAEEKHRAILRRKARAMSQCQRLSSAMRDVHTCCS